MNTLTEHEATEISLHFERVVASRNLQIARAAVKETHTKENRVAVLGAFDALNAVLRKEVEHSLDK